MLTEGSVRPPIQILLQSGKRLKGKLVEVSAAGLTVKRRGSDTILSHGDIRQIRITHWTTRKKYRWLYGLGGYFGSGAAMGALGERIQSPVIFIAAWAFVIKTTIYFYKLGARADRGAVVIELIPSIPAPATPGSVGAQ